MKQTRRDFISTVMAGGVVAPFLTDIQSSKPQLVKESNSIRLFSKPLDSYDFEFICDCAAGSGIGGLDLTVRKGGKVEPEVVESSLPGMVEKAGDYNLKIDMIVTGIVSAADKYTEKILKTAALSGVKYYRLGWFEYDRKNGVWETIQKFRTCLTDIAGLNRKYKIHGGYQNHSGILVGGPVWDLHELLRDFPPEYLGSQYDIRHAMVEGTSTWSIGMRLVAPHIKTLAIKDFTWKSSGGKPEPVTVPLGEGLVDWDLFFKMVKELNILAPLTLHIEYPLLEKGDEKSPLIKQQELITGKIKKDADFIKGYLKKYQLF
jgi:sugar phosphate isomerase/epimerase